MHLNRLSTAVSSNRKGKKNSGERSPVPHSELFISLCHCRVESKKTESTHMNPRKTTIAVLAALSVSLALADDFETINGKEYKNVEVGRQGRAQRRGLHRALLLAPARIARR